jgi:hypothetical protein
VSSVPPVPTGSSRVGRELCDFRQFGYSRRSGGTFEPRRGNGFKVAGEGTGDGAGFALSGAGDVNGDGFADIIIGAPTATANAITSGASYILYGSPRGFAATIGLSSLDGSNGFKINGESEDDQFGTAVSGAGDVNGDGFADYIIVLPVNPHTIICRCQLCHLLAEGCSRAALNAGALTASMASSSSAKTMAITPAWW